MIATKLVKKRKNPPRKIGRLPVPMPNPATLKGGMTAVAMATPGMMVRKFFLVQIATAPAMPANKAMMRS